MNARDVGFGLAAAAVTVGLLAVFTPAIDPEALGADGVRPLIGAGSLAAGAVFLRRWYRTDPSAHEPLERERLAPVGVPGEDVDDLLALAGSRSEEVGRYYRSLARDQFEDVAVAVLTTHRNYAPGEARAALYDGSWTNDPVAARYFRSGSDAVDDVRGFVASSVGTEHPTARRARRAVAELRRIAGVAE